MPTLGTKRVYTIDPTHSDVSFSVRHMMLSKVRGQFRVVAGTIELGDTGDVPLALTAEIDAASIDTREAQRDGHLKSADFLDVATHSHLRFASTSIVPGTGANFEVVGNLEIHGVQQSVKLKAEVAGHTTDPWGNDRIAYSATTRINRKDYGLIWNQTLETGGILVGEDIDIELEIQAIAAK
jgi:polyisoprenoid-binding protein YceI